MNAFGIRHLSPAGAYYIRKYLEKHRPKLILIEAPSDFTALLPNITDARIQPPFSIMAYTLTAPVQTILYPFAIYSPEYQALLWGKEHNVLCECIDLPSNIFLGIADINLKAKEKYSEDSFQKSPINIYTELNKATMDGDSEVFWERVLEHSTCLEDYEQGSYLFGKNLRELTIAEKTTHMAENLIREAYMCRKIQDAIERGYREEEIVVLTGAFHTEAIKNMFQILTDEELQKLPSVESQKTLMPYSYYRLSERSGYGAGNHAPAYYEFLWENRILKKPDYHVYKYLSSLGKHQREHGNMVSSAEIIEAVRLSYTLANLHDSKIPSLADLKDAAITCMGHGNFSELALAFASTDIGTKIGSIPKQATQTSIQADFYEKLRILKLEKYRSVVAEELVLDLRENLRVKSRELAFLDLHRSFFLHRLQTLGIAFASKQKIHKDSASWQEKWVLQWTPEAEIQVVESILKGDTLDNAVSFTLSEQLRNANSLVEISKVFQEAFFCGIPESVYLATECIDHLSSQNISIHDIASTVTTLNLALHYGDIRKLDLSSVLPLLSKLTLRATLHLEEESICDETAAGILSQDILDLSTIIMENENLEKELWIHTLSSIASRDDVNTKISGLCMAILLDMGEVESQRLGMEVERRLSKGMPAELGAGWFEGLSMKNHYSLIIRQSIWEKLSTYIDTLDTDEFKRSLVCLRRAFANYSPEEKDQIAENLGELWNINPTQVSEILNTEVPKLTQEVIAEIESFDFDF